MAESLHNMCRTLVLTLIVTKGEQYDFLTQINKKKYSTGKREEFTVRLE